jgi:hypothetical protein
MFRPLPLVKTGFFTLMALMCGLNIVPAVAQDAAEESGDWPRVLDTQKYEIVIYQPQLESYQNDRLESRAAVSIKKKGENQPMFGAVWFDARMATDFDTRMVSLEEVKVSAAKFPNLNDEQVVKLSNFLEKEIPEWDLSLSLDRLLADAAALEDGGRSADNLKNDPPEIIFVKQASVLVMIDGDPNLSQLEGTELKYVVNTPYFIVQDTGSNTYYLRGGGHWFSTKDLMGKWVVTGDLPKSMQEVAKKVEEEEKKKAEEAEADLTDEEKKANEELGEPDIPEIFVRTQPTELIETHGEPDFASVKGTELLYLKNTEGDVVMEISSQQYYVLLAGRWYASSSLEDGEWKFIPHNELPEEFAKIPAESDMGNVRASIPGTQEAKEAVLENDIPQTAEVSRKDAKVDVKYDGDPKFEKCTDNGVHYAVNTDKSVLLIDGKYYCCDDAIWFVGEGPEGPWIVADKVPDKVQDIPPECPVYNVKYVYIYESTPEVVYVGYTPGYVGSYYYGGCVVYGTGWWYRPWYHTYYYPRPVTWGYGVHWNPYTGWGFHVGVSYGWLHIGVGWGRPWYGGWWGAAGYRHGYRHGYHHGYRHGYRHGARAGYRAGYRAGQRQGNHNMYRNRSSGVNRTGGRQTARAQPTRGGTTTGRSKATTGARAPTTKKTPQTTNRKNNVYSDRNGNVYRNQGGGNWQKNTGKGNWSNSKGSQNMNKQSQARQRGSTKTQNYRSSGASRSGGRSGGRRSGGGGRRR